MTPSPLAAHSLAEALLFLMATPCPACGKGPLRGHLPQSLSDESNPQASSRADVRPAGNGSGSRLDPPPADAGRSVFLLATCGSCGDSGGWTFEIESANSRSAEGPPVINPTDKPSRILDVAQWITLFRMVSAKAGEQSDKQVARRLLLEAGQCLGEALKFYEPDNDLPPPSAFFHAGSRERLRSHPEQFSRQRLLDLRNKLPTEIRPRPKP